MGNIQYSNSTLEEMKRNDFMYNNTIYLDYELDRDSQIRPCREIRTLCERELAKPTNRRKPIKIMISSFGGAAYSLFSIVSLIEYYDEQGLIIETYCEGFTASAGSKILMAGTKGHRYISRYGKVLIHQPNGMCYGTYQDMKKQMEDLEDDFDTVKDMFRKHTKLTENDLREMSTVNHDIILKPQECIEKGLVDNLL